MSFITKDCFWAAVSNICNCSSVIEYLCQCLDCNQDGSCAKRCTIKDSIWKEPQVNVVKYVAHVGENYKLGTMASSLKSKLVMKLFGNKLHNNTLNMSVVFSTTKQFTNKIRLPVYLAVITYQKNGITIKLLNGLICCYEEIIAEG